MIFEKTAFLVFDECLSGIGVGFEPPVVGEAHT